MAKYTRPGAQTPNQLRNNGSPMLLFKKWQAYDDFSSFKTTKSREPYWESLQKACERVHGKKYRVWLASYKKALNSIPGIQCIDQYKTQWRLLVGYGTNPTLESGIVLHHFYGFPYIPASEVKGLLHHVAEMLAMEGITDARGNQVNLPEVQRVYDGRIDFNTNPQSILINTLNYLSTVKALFGSIHLEKGKDDDNRPVYGPTPPLEILQQLRNNIKDQMDASNLKKTDLSDIWQQVIDQVLWLYGEHTGGILRFYDAVPAPEEEDLLEMDVLTPHYPQYYEGSNTLPTDSQSPNPVTFLTVKPGVRFLFYYRNEYVSIMRANDDASKEIKTALEGWSEQQVREQVKQWLHKALTEWGIGAKTAAGYGYFLNETTTPPPGDGGGTIELERIEVPVSGEISPEEAPTPKTNPRPNKPGKNYAPEVWETIGGSPFIAAIDGEKANKRPIKNPLPNRYITANGRKMTVYYQNGEFFCTVSLKLNGINNERQAEWVWRNVILPQLPKSKEGQS